MVVNFPFADVNATKRRPALVLAVADRSDVLLCQITGQLYSFDPHAIPLDNADFTTGGLKQPSRVRPHMVFTFERNAILYQVGQIRASKLEQAISALITILRGPVH